MNSQIKWRCRNYTCDSQFRSGKPRPKCPRCGSGKTEKLPPRKPSLAKLMQKW